MVGGARKIILTVLYLSGKNEDEFCTYLGDGAGMEMKISGGDEDGDRDEGA